MSERGKLKSELIQEVAQLQKRIKDLESAAPANLEMESGDIWREFAEHSNAHMVILGDDLVIQYVNRPSPGLTYEDLIGKQITQFLDGDKAQEIRDILVGVMNSEEPAVYETEFIPSSGGIIYYETHATPRIENDQVIGLLLSSRDITNRKKAEKDIATEREKLQSIYRSAPIGIGVISNRVFIFVNEFFCQMIGYQAEEIINRDARIIYPSEEIYDYVGKEKYRQIELYGVGTVETKIKKKNGEIIDVLLSSSPIDQKDLSQGVTFSALDITERKRAERALKESQRQLAVLISNLPGMAYRCKNDHSYTMEYVSSGVETLTGYTPDDLVNNSKIEYISIIHPDDRELVRAGVLDGLSKNAPFQIIYRIITSAGSEKWVWEQGQGITGEENTIVALEGFVIDITERINSEQALKASNTIINNSPAVAFSWLKEDGWPVEFVSSNVEQLFGYSTEDFLSRKIVYEDLIYSEDLARVIDEVEVSAESRDGVTIFHEPYRVIAKNGDIKWVSDKTSFTRDNNGNIESYQGVVFDITGEVEATERLRKRTQELKSLLETSQALNLSLEINEVLQIVTDTAADFTGIDSVAIYLADGEELYLGATTPPLDPDMPEIFRRAILSDHPHIQEAVSRKQLIILEDTHSAKLTEAERVISDARGLRTVVYLPISVGDNVLGILILGTIGFPRIFSNEDLNLWQTMANQTATSLENALLHDQAVKRAIDLEEQIRERERVEQTLIENEQNFRDLVENLQDGVAIADENGLHLFVNSRLSEITGYSKTELLKMTGRDFSGPEEQGKYEARMKDGLSGKALQANYERILLKKDGKEIPVEMSPTTTIWQGERRPMAIIRDITERKLVERDKDILLIQVQEANDRLRSLSRELISSQEAERKRISQELHDEFGQALTAISLDLGILERQLDLRNSPEVQERIADLRQTVDQLDQMIGELALDLRPSLLDDLGLLPTLNWYLERFSQRSETKVEIEVSGEEKRLPTEIETALYRIIQEALTNVAKHAGASVVVLRLNHQPDRMTACIEDDGKGFDLNELHNAKTPFQGLGLIGMGDRTALLGGQLDIQSIPGEGTKIKVVIPL